MTEKNNVKNKLAQAMQDAAIANINEDILDILTTLENIRNDIPSIVGKEAAFLLNDVTALKHALEAVPIEYDKTFHHKINAILDITDEIAKHSRRLESSLEFKINDLFSKQEKELLSKINSQIQGFSLTSNVYLIVYGFLSSVVGGFIFLAGAMLL